MSRPRRPAFLALFRLVTGLVLCLGEARPLVAYERKTHEEISVLAVTRSETDRILKERYGLQEGVDTVVNGKSVREWVGSGGDLEDVPALRALNHFHDPLEPWSGAGLFPGQSSVYWQQNPTQGAGGAWSWPVARTRFFESLTLRDRDARDRALADAARALGQVMHLVQDATSPAHVRNDPHLIFDGYEARMEELRASRTRGFAPASKASSSRPRAARIPPSSRPPEIPQIPKPRSGSRD